MGLESDAEQSSSVTVFFFLKFLSFSKNLCKCIVLEFQRLILHIERN